MNPWMKWVAFQCHLPLARTSPTGEFCDWDAPLAQKAKSLADRIRGTHFPEIRPAKIVTSRAPYTNATAALMWPGAHVDATDSRFGPDLREMGIWREFQNLPKTATGKEFSEANPSMIDRLGRDCIRAIGDLHSGMETGKLLWCVSHSPHTDVVARIMREGFHRNLSEGSGWLPNRFESGAFMLAGYFEDELKYCRYYTVPRA